MLVTLLCVVALTVLCCALTADWLERRARRRDREIVRRITRYLDATRR